MFCAYTIAATFWLLFATAVGVLMSYKFGAPDFWPGKWLTFGRLRPIHTNDDTFYGWASLALVGLAYYVAARSLRTTLYTIGGVLWTCIIAVVAILPWYQYGLGQVSVSGFYMHNAVGMWFTPLALGIFYYALPKLLNRPIYSYALGVFAFWTNLVFYPIIGAHHFLFSPLPWFLQTTAIVFSVAMLVPV